MGLAFTFSETSSDSAFDLSPERQEENRCRIAENFIIPRRKKAIIAAPDINIPIKRNVWTGRGRAPVLLSELNFSIPSGIVALSAGGMTSPGPKCSVCVRIAAELVVDKGVVSGVEVTVAELKLDDVGRRRSFVDRCFKPCFVV